MVEGPKISFSPKLNIEESKFKKIVPGPGAYKPEVSKKADFSFSFGLKTQPMTHKYIMSVPGPGNYSLNREAGFSRRGASLDKSPRLEPLNKT